MRLLLIISIFRVAGAGHSKSVKIVPGEYVEKYFNADAGKKFLAQRMYAMNVTDMYWHEIVALERLATVDHKCSDGADGRSHFPRLFWHDDASLTFRSSHDGVPFHDYGPRLCELSFENITQQVTCIEEFLKKADLTHCDSGIGNFLIHDATVVLFDWDISMVGPLPEKWKQHCHHHLDLRMYTSKSYHHHCDDEGHVVPGTFGHDRDASARARKGRADSQPRPGLI